MPTLFTRMSRSPIVSKSRRMHPSRAATSVTSTSKNSAPIAAAVAAPRTESISQNATRSPRRTKASTMPFPIPWAPPVTNTLRFICAGFQQKYPFSGKNPSRRAKNKRPGAQGPGEYPHTQNRRGAHPPLKHGKRQEGPASCLMVPYRAVRTADSRAGSDNPPAASAPLSQGLDSEAAAQGKAACRCARCGRHVKNCTRQRCRTNRF